MTDDLLFATGKQCLSADSTPTDCASGTYNLESSTTACVVCPGGYYCALTTVSPLPCSTGMNPYLLAWLLLKKKNETLLSKPWCCVVCHVAEN